MKNWVRDNGLTLVLLGIFLLSLTGQALTGWSSENQTRAEHHVAPLIFTAYVGSGAFLSALFENWESEFLQMWAFVMLTAYLYQRGSPESKDPDKAAPQDRDPALDEKKRDAPWPVRAGGLVRVVYSHSLGLALLVLFLASFALHLINSARNAADEAIAHGQTAPTIGAYAIDPEFWFESFQNWQSEFLSTAVLIVLAVYLRERGSPESKPVAAPNAKTGTD
jgi:hypothetical protein